jgi:hypothetical protein
VQEYEEDEQKGATDFKSSEEETGLGKYEVTHDL